MELLYLWHNNPNRTATDARRWMVSWQPGKLSKLQDKFVSSRSASTGPCYKYTRIRQLRQAQLMLDET